MTFKHEFTCSVPNRKAEVFSALSEAKALREWFAEHADVEPREGGKFQFWGKHTLGSPSRATASQSITRFAKNDALAFSWRLLDRDSEVAWTLTEEKGDDGAVKTKLAIAHSFDALPAGPRAKELIDDLWRLNCGNLTAYLNGGEGIVLPDYDDPSPEVRQSIVIDAPSETVFAALTDPKYLKEWFWAPNPQVELKKGGRYVLGWSYEIDGRKVDGGPTKIIDFTPNEKLVTDFGDWRGDPSMPAQTVTWLLEDIGGKTRVTVVHNGFTRTTDISDFPFGWVGFLAQLKTSAEGAQA